MDLKLALNSMSALRRRPHDPAAQEQATRDRGACCTGMVDGMIRSAVKPKVPVRKSSIARDVATASVKLHKCSNKECRKPFVKMRIDQKVCGWECSAVVGAEQTKKELRKESAARRLAIKTRSQHMKDAQVAFNAFIRARDDGKLCICCDRPLPLKSIIGGGFDCGHYRSVGSAPHLRFDERNANGQTKKCNRYGAGRAVDYRIGLIRRIGLAAVESLESDQSSPKWTIDELRAIKALYRRKLKEIQS